MNKEAVKNVKLKFEKSLYNKKKRKKKKKKIMKQKNGKLLK